MLFARGKYSIFFNANDTLNFISLEVETLVGDTPSNPKKVTCNVWKNQSMCFLMFACMADDAVHKFNEIEYAKVMWEISTKCFRVILPTRF